ncbi:MAG TPA: hypothetical protein VLH41_07210, partial [Thermoanaerobaculia bacterium]|nr:hypothetical protein [Thermoanaerobaculia bacterium]
MRHTVRPSGAFSRALRGAFLAALAAGLALAPAAPALGALGAAQGTELWGGPGAKGAGTNARFDTNVYVTGASPATGTVEFWQAGEVVATMAFSIPARGTNVVAAPAALDGKGAFLVRIRTDVPVSAWTETYNDAPSGRFGLSIAAFGNSEFLNPGDEAAGGGADASTSTAPGRARTNVGLLCSGNGTQACEVEVAAFDAGALLAAATISAGPGAAAQQSLAALLPGAAEKSALSLRFRILAGAAQPYAIRNDNQTSDATLIPLAVTRGAFSTAPSIDSYTLTPTTGCAPLSVTAEWATTGATKVTLSGVSGDLPPSGSKTFSLAASQEVILTAIAASGVSSSQSLRVTLTPPANPATPSPASATVLVGKPAEGFLPSNIGPVTVAFAKQESTGSTFTVSANRYTYVAGSTAGTDVVTLTTTGACGDVTATFTATVVTSIPVGTPVITSFRAEPALGCAPANILLTWTTENVVSVELPGVPTLGPLPANGAVGVTLNVPTTFTLKAFNAAGEYVVDTLDVPVDLQAYYPVIDPAVNNQIWKTGSVVAVSVTGVP